jgi:glycosyltransferase involved in cell wall biosynthesis
MSFSVLLSVYVKESPEFLKLALESIWDKQTLKPNEIVLVKDGPIGENLEGVISDFQEVAPLKVVALEKNMGLGKALNIGLKHCSNEYVARMDTDDIAFSCRFEKQIGVLEANKNIDVISAWISEFENNTDNVISVRKLPEQHYEIFNFAKKRCPINHPCVIFRKSVVEAVGGYKHFPLFEDYYLWIRLLINDAKFYNIQESLLSFRVDKNMYKRRGGIKHAINDYKLQKAFYDFNFINLSEFCYNIITRCFARVIPNSCRILIYKHFLRK